MIQMIETMVKNKEIITLNSQSSMKADFNSSITFFIKPHMVMSNKIKFYHKKWVIFYKDKKNSRKTKIIHVNFVENKY